MATFALPVAYPAKRVVTIGTSLASGLVNGLIVRKNATIGVITTWASLIGGAAGAMLTKGLPAELFEGLAAGGAGVIGFALPDMLKPSAAPMAARVTGAVRAVQTGMGQAMKQASGYRLTS